ncbi:MAG TPA: hypothetical protein VGR51_06340 [Thermoplasmata archaeon]|nr:hypothetical protein [Thermoplasmata archaeon]
MRSVRVLLAIAPLLLVALVLVPSPASATITLTPISTGFNGLIGIDHHEPTNQVIVSVNYPTGVPHNFELVASDGTRTPFSSISGFTNEVKIGTVREGPCQGGFTPGEVFTGTGVEGVVARISPDGSIVANPWVTLFSEVGLMRGSLFQDRYCSFGGDLIVVTTVGNVWRITAAGVATRVWMPPTNVLIHLEGLTTVPNDPSRYGPWAGTILAGAEGLGCVFSITATGDATCWSLGINPEDIDLIPANENFFGVDFGSQTLWGAPPSEFAAMIGDVLIAQEFPGILFRVRWDAGTGAFQVEQLAEVAQWEHVTFSTAGIVEIPGTEDACPLSQGFWKNHPGEWPEPSLVLGDETYAQDELLALLRRPVKGDASLILAKQLIATRLNVANGSDPGPVAATLADTDALFAALGGKLPYGVRASSSLGANMTALSAVLDDYNNRLLTPDCGDSIPDVNGGIPTGGPGGGSRERPLSPLVLGLAALALAALSRRGRRPL